MWQIYQIYKLEKPVTLCQINRYLMVMIYFLRSELSDIYDFKKYLDREQITNGAEWLRSFNQ